MRTAEQRLIACLLQDPGLFQQTLEDGSGVDEAVSPAELTDPEHRALYSRIYDALADGRALNLATLLGELASEGRHDQIRLATDADHELEKIIAGDPDQRRQVLTDAVEALIAHRREQEYEAFKGEHAPGRSDDATDAEAAARIILHRAEMLNRRARPGTIARR